MMRVLLLSSIMLALSACTPPASDTGVGETTPAPAAAAPAFAGELRAGRWRQAITVMGRTSNEVQCVTSTDLSQVAAAPNSNCTSPSFSRTAEGLVYEAECTGAEGGGHIRTVMNGDMQNNYVADVTMSAPGMPEGMRIHIEATYEGACRGDE